MTTPSETAPSAATTKFEPANVNVRVRISALWTAVMLVFAYVDLFGLYRADVRADIEAGVISGFAIDQAYLLATTVFVAIPSLMIFATLVLRPRVNRIANIVLSITFALAIIVGAIGTWNYYLLGSAIEVALLSSVVYFAWTWPRLIPATSTSELDATRQHIPPTAAEAI